MAGWDLLWAEIPNVTKSKHLVETEIQAEVLYVSPISGKSVLLALNGLGDCKCKWKLV